MQLRLQPLQPPGIGVLARADAHNALECALQVLRAEAQVRPQRIQRRRAVEMLFDIAAGVGYPGDLRRGLDRALRAAALAGAEARLLGRWRRGEKDHLRPA